MLGIGEPPAGVEITTPGVAGSVTTFNSITLGSGHVIVDASVAGNHSYGSGIYLNDLSIVKDGQTFSSDNWSARLVVVADRSAPGSSILPGGQMRAEIPMVISDTNGDGDADSCSILGDSEPSSEPELVVGQTGPVDCEGSTGATIQSCLNMVTASKTSVLIKAGVYTGVNNMIIPPGITLRGEPGTILQGSAAGPMLSVTGPGNSGVIIKDLAFTLGAATSAISASGINNLRVEGNQFNNTAAAAGVGVNVTCASCNGLIIEKNRFGNPVTSFLGTGILVTASGTSRDLLLNQNTFRAGGAAAIRMNVNGVTDNVRVLSNSIAMTGATTTGMDFVMASTLRGATISLNNVEVVAGGGATSRGMRLSGSGVLDTSTVSSNSIDMAATMGIPLLMGTITATDVFVEANTLQTDVSVDAFTRGGAAGPHSSTRLSVIRNSGTGRMSFTNTLNNGISISDNNLTGGLLFTHAAVTSHANVRIARNTLRSAGSDVGISSDVKGEFSAAVVDDNVIQASSVAASHLAGISLLGRTMGSISGNQVTCSTAAAANAVAYTTAANYKTNAPPLSGIYIGTIFGTVNVSSNQVSSCSYGIALPELVLANAKITDNIVDGAAVGIAASIGTILNVGSNNVFAKLPLHLISMIGGSSAVVHGNTLSVPAGGPVAACMGFAGLGTGIPICAPFEDTLTITGNDLNAGAGRSAIFTGISSTFPTKSSLWGSKVTGNRMISTVSEVGTVIVTGTAAAMIGP